MALKVSLIIIAAVIGGYFVFQNYVDSQAVGKTNENILESASSSIQQMTLQTSEQKASVSSNLINSNPNKILTEDNFYAQLMPLSVQITDKGRYNLLQLEVIVNMQDLPIDANVFFRNEFTTLVDETSKIYKPDKAECPISEFTRINGKVSDTATYNLCYSVTKDSKKFTIFYTEPLFNYHATKAGHLILDQSFFDYYKSNHNPNPTKIGTIDLTK